ncbi:hypothetical protein [Aeromonas sp. 602293]|uniref:hypothetical protein n=1 Tax=Aeromonas sp. 602293 TaxID=2712041 RepID=UPI003A3EDFEC
MTDQQVVCAKCGKKKGDMDLAGDGQPCRSPVIMSSAVGDWFCQEKPVEGEE